MELKFATRAKRRKAGESSLDPLLRFLVQCPSDDVDLQQQNLRGPLVLFLPETHDRYALMCQELTYNVTMGPRIESMDIPNINIVS